MIDVKVSGVDDVIKELEKLTNETDTIMKRTVYNGMKVVADTMNAKVKALKTTKDYKSKGKRYLTENEKKGLVESFGVTPISNRGYTYDAKAGFDGYNEYVKSHPANPMIANFANRGTSYMKAQPFISQTKRAAESKAYEYMKEALNEEIKKRTT
jgi:HK97 gp10 family phage protein